MSRVGKKIITIAEGVDVQIHDREITVKGPRGSLGLIFDQCLQMKVADKILTIATTDPKDLEKKTKMLWGLTRNLVGNMVLGVTKGFEKKLEIQGVGYRANSGKDNKLNLELGFSHPIEYLIPDGIEIKVEKNMIIVTGIDKQKVGQVSAEIRAFRPPEPYKGKGIRYADEYVRRKAGKKATTEGAK
ncbi:50S ribosomal protein L6 [bacterium (Candidatus Torokbacteria) CG09_land_8_20_14_0_10_42_11]|nr:MAG: 50S ribosomal protein L6 [bacterium (Candidatus Torokbacteria) CG09_land_8_20_14_0_10_42_11]